MQGLSDLLTRLKVEQQLEALIAAKPRRAIWNSAITSKPGGKYRGCWRCCKRFWRAKRGTLAEFERLLDRALENLSLGLIPPTVDQVLVSSVTRSRVPELDAVFVLGVLEGQMPKVLPEDPILSDAQRKRLTSRPRNWGRAAQIASLRGPISNC